MTVAATPPDVTIVVSARRRPALLDRCLAELLREAPDLHEIVVVAAEDDGGSALVAGAWARRDARVRLARRPAGGEGAARNAGVAAASGAWCWFVEESWGLPRSAHMALRAALIPARARAAAGFVRAPSAQFLLTPPCFAAEKSLLKSDPFDESLGHETQALRWLRRRAGRILRLRHFAPGAAPLAGPEETARALGRIGVRGVGAAALERIVGRGELLVAAFLSRIRFYDWPRLWADWRERASDDWRGRVGRWRRRRDDALRWSAERLREFRATASLKRAIADWAASAPLGGALRPLFVLYYACARRAVSAWARAARQPAEDLRVHRGYAGGHWTPGVSDIDFAATWVAAPDDEASAIARWSRGYARLRAVFPMLGEATLADARGWAAFSAHGGFRAGREGEPARVEEALLAYGALTGAFLSAGRGARRSLATAKGFIDVARLCVQGPALDRPAAARALASGPDGALLRRAVADDVRAAAELCARAAARLERAARAVAPPAASDAALVPRAAPFAAAAAEARDACARLGAALGAGPRWAVFDSVAGVRAELAALAGEGAAERWSAMRALKTRDLSLQGGLLAAGPATLELFVRSAAGDDPLKALSWRAAAGGGVSGAGPLLRRHAVAVCGDAAALPGLPARGRVDAAMAEHAATTLLHWRGRIAGPDGASAEDRWTRLVGAALSLRAWAERGELLPAFPLEPLALRHAAAHPEDADWIRRRVLEALEPAFAAEDVAALARQMRAIGARLDAAARGSGAG
jgi:hypothetical protein